MEFTFEWTPVTDGRFEVRVPFLPITTSPASVNAAVFYRAPDGGDDNRRVGIKFLHGKRHIDETRDVCKRVRGQTRASPPDGGLAALYRAVDEAMTKPEGVKDLAQVFSKAPWNLTKNNAAGGVSDLRDDTNPPNAGDGRSQRYSAQTSPGHVHFAEVRARATSYGRERYYQGYHRATPNASGRGDWAPDQHKRSFEEPWPSDVLANDDNDDDREPTLVVTSRSQPTEEGAEIGSEFNGLIKVLSKAYIAKDDTIKFGVYELNIERLKTLDEHLTQSNGRFGPPFKNYRLVYRKKQCMKTNCENILNAAERRTAKGLPRENRRLQKRKNCCACVCAH